MGFKEFVELLVGPFGVIPLGAGIAVAFYLRLVVLGIWWRTERSARLRAEARCNRLVLTLGRVTGASETFLDALRESPSEVEASEPG